MPEFICKRVLTAVNCHKNFQAGKKIEMCRNKIVCLTLLSMLLLAVCCQTCYSADTVLTLDDLPDVGGSLVITSDSVLTVDEGESAVVDEAVLQINGTDDAVTEFEIVNNGLLTIMSTRISCNRANFTIQNTGTIDFRALHFTVIGNSTFSLENEGSFDMNDVSVDVYGGYANFRNTGTVTIHNGYFKDQFDGTVFTNFGFATLSNTVFVANGAKGRFDIENGGDIKFHQCTFDVNYGALINLNTDGSLLMNSSNIDVSGWSHGQQSGVNIGIGPVGGSAIWESCGVNTNGGNVNYQNLRESRFTDCQLTASSLDGNINIATRGPFTFENSCLGGAGSVNVANFDSLTLINSFYNSSNYLTLYNFEDGEISAENWLVKTLHEDAEVYVTNEGNITFNPSFIEDVSSSAITSVGSEGHEFVEDSGGIITVTNKGSFSGQSSTDGGSDSTLIYILAIVVAAIIVIVVFFMVKKKKPN